MNNRFLTQICAGVAPILTLFLSLFTAQSASVNLAWDPSVATDLAGYFVYCGTTSGVYTVTLSTPTTVTTSTVPNLVAGQTYYFAVTSSNIAGLQSAYSSELSYTIPLPNTPPVASPQSIVTPENAATGITLSGTDADGNALTYAVVSGPTHGTLSGSAPNLTYLPATNFYGSDSFTFKANDGMTDSIPATVSINVTFVNHPPVATAQSVTTLENTSKSITLSGTDVDGNALTYQVVASPGHGTLSGTAPNLSYLPATNYFGTDSFTFKANDGMTDSAPATVSINVTFVNHPPVATAQSVSTLENTSTAITLAGTDVDGNALTYQVVSGPTHGALSGTAPNLTYLPATNYFGTDSFTFKANDGMTDSAPATVSINVTFVNHPPVATPQSVTTPENTSKSITLTGTDVDGNALTYQVVASPGHGTLAGTAPNLTYLPATNYFGTDSFTFKANDGMTDSVPATVSINVTFVNHPPVATPQSVSTLENTSAAITLTGTDVDGNALTYQVVAGPTHGTLSGTAPSLTYLPATNYFGADSFTFKANDGMTDSVPATVSINVTFVNHPPVATAQSVTTPENTSKSITLAGTDADGNALTYQVVAGPAHGALSGTAPNLNYLPATNYFGADSFTFKANDGITDCAPATVSINVTFVNHPPVATPQSVTTLENTSTALTLAGTDVDGNALTYQVVTGPAHGALSGTAPNLTYLPATNFFGSDSFTFKANDGMTDSVPATVSINVTFVNHPPVATPQSITTLENSSTAITLAGTDVDGNALTYQVVTGPGHGTLAGTAPNLTYLPATNFFGSDSFTFKANDGMTDSAPATVSINVAFVNHPPVATAQTVTTAENTPLAITLSGTDVDGNALSYTVASGPTHGVLTGTAPSMTYTPATNYYGSDSFWFSASDGMTNSALAVVSINVTAVNHAPVASSQAVTTAANSALPITLSATDIDGNPLTFAVVTPPAHGVLTGTAPALTYSPAANYSGSDSFTFKANDGIVDSAPATVSINVTAINQPPTLDPIADVTIGDSSGVQVLSLSGITAGAGETQTLSVSATSSNPTLIPAPTVTYTSPAQNGSLTFAPAANATGTAVVSVTVSDGQAQNSTVTRSFTVTVTSDTPAVTMDPVANLTLPQGSSPQVLALTGISSKNVTPLAVFLATYRRQPVPAITLKATSSDTSLIPTPTISYTSPNRTATLALTPASNASGTALIAVTVSDGISVPLNRTFTVTVSAGNIVNAAPTLDPLANLTLSTGAGTQTVTLTGISAGPGESQPLSVTATSSNPSLIPSPVVNYASPAATGSLSFTPAPAASGSSTISVTVNDGQSQNNTVTRTFTVTVSAATSTPTPTIAVASPTSGAVYTVPATVNLNASVNASGHTVSSVQYFSDGTFLGESTTPPYSFAWNAGTTGAHSLVARLYYDGSSTVDSQPTTITLSALPAPWQTADIGSVAAAGSVSLAGNVFTVTGAGNLSGTADNFRFLYQPLVGDGSITVSLDSAGNTGADARSGIMIRENLSPGSRYAFVGISPDGLIRTQRRNSTGASTSSATVAGGAPRIWLRLVRSNNTLSAYYSTDGTRWTSAGFTSINMAKSIYIGVAVASGVPDAVNTITLDTPAVVP
jgi:hypothetical protein